jgi:hypothetical protein
MLIFRIVILLGLVRLLIVSGKPLWCSSIYAALVVGGGLFFSGSIMNSLVEGGIAFALATCYFWLLRRFDNSFIWWGIFILGPLIALV